jgi:glycerol-3-phosphate acyltransferase PlsX
MQQGGVEIFLVGPTHIIEEELSKYNTAHLTIPCIEAKELIKEGEHPALALQRKPEASVAVAARLVKQGQADAMVTMGSTGAAMVSSLYTLGTFEGIERPVLAGPFLGFAPNTVVVDYGANVDCKPHHLVNFAVIGCVLAQKFLNIPHPTVALLSIGAEEGKGNNLVRESYPLFKNSGLNFIGNVEGNDIPLGKANVIVCDGFVGNILVKFCESLGGTIAAWLRESLQGQLPAGDINSLAEKLVSLTNPAEVYGGGPLLGVNGVVIVGHGRSRAPEVAKAIHQAKYAVEIGFVETLKSELSKAQAERVQAGVGAPGQARNQAGVRGSIPLS